MPAPAKTRCCARFGEFEINLRRGELRHHGTKISLQEKPFQILSLLLEEPGELVTREELREKLWPDKTFVDFEHGINTAVKKLREALGDEAEKPRFIETLPRRGYRFIVPVEFVAPVSSAAPVAAVLALWAAMGTSPLPIQSIAVLPLENLSGNPEQEFLADAMTEELITNLGKCGRLRVISRTSVMRYKGTRKPIPEIAKELNVDALVEGAVRRSGDRVRITANLIHAPTDHHLWAEAYERDLKDALTVQSDVTSDIAYEIRAKLTPREAAGLISVGSCPVNPKAYEAYLKGRYYTHQFTQEGYQKSNEYLAQAIKADPNYAPAYAALAENCVQACLFSVGPEHDEIYAKGRASSRRALELDPSLAEAHAARAGVACRLDWDWALAEREFQCALQLNPNLVTARESYAEFLLRMGRAEEAIAEYKRTLELDPFSLVVNTQLSWAYGNAGRYEETVAQLQQVLELAPNFVVARFNLGEIYEMCGRHEEAIRELQTALAADKENWLFLAYLGFAYGRANKQPEALRVLAQLQIQAKEGRASHIAMAAVHLGLGHHDEALSHLESAYERREAWMISLKASPEFDPLRSDPRFQDLLRRMNFPP